MTSLTIENYLKAIYRLSTDEPSGLAATGQLAEAMGVSPGTVTSMLKTLRESGLAEYTPYEGVRLTEAGRQLALRVMRRHRLIELFLARTLNMAWDEVHEEAEHLEHAASDRLVDRIDAFLGHPKTDPHGDPIPTSDGCVRRPDWQNLADWPIDQPFRLVRVADQRPEFLRYLSDRKLGLFTEGRILATDDVAGVVTIQTMDGQLTLSRDVAQQLLVEPADERPPT